VISSSAGIVAATLSQGSELQIAFDVNVQGPEDCESIFDPKSMNALGGTCCNILINLKTHSDLLSKVRVRKLIESINGHGSYLGLFV